MDSRVDRQRRSRWIRVPHLRPRRHRRVRSYLDHARWSAARSTADRILWIRGRARRDRAQPQDYLWLLAGGFGPFEAVDYPDSDREINVEIAELAAQYASADEKSARDVIRLANEEFPDFRSDDSRAVSLNVLFRRFRSA